MTATAVRGSIEEALARNEPVAKIMAELDVTYTAVKRARDKSTRGRTCGSRCACFSMPCGTPAGFDRHLRRGEYPCEPCRVAAADREFFTVYGHEPELVNQ